MYLKNLTITNFRKFGKADNTVEFVSPNKAKLENTVSALTTLIVGKNNCGKTTVSEALKKVVNSNNIVGNDFNFKYLNDFLENYDIDKEKATPFLEFKLVIGVNFSSDDLVTNLVPFLTVDDVSDNKENVELTIKVKYEIKEEDIFKTKLKDIFSQSSDSNYRFRLFLELIDNTEFQKNYYRNNDVEKINGQVSLDKLINLVSIDGNQRESNLSTAFNKIIKYRYDLLKNKSEKDAIDKEITGINEKITEQIQPSNQYVNTALNKVEHESLGIALSSDLTFDKLMSNLIKYEFIEQGFYVPQKQFGSGYSNLMNIIAQVIKYVDQTLENTQQSQINLICIEEPETFMHPQMQELFIKHIDDAVLAILEDKKINSQLIITTHSSHILNSKIHKSNSFDNINYLKVVNHYSNVVNLTDDILREKNKKLKSASADFNFLKKHIKYKVSELFFSDAIIFVEGNTEETLLPFYIEKNYPNLSKYYISIFNVNGAHSKVYYPLIEMIEIPTLIIADLDIKRKDNANSQITNLQNENENEKTTNSTIQHFKGDSNLDNIDYFKENNLYVVFQKEQIHGYYATSFEEAFILTNYQNEVLHSALKKAKKTKYIDIVEVSPEKCENLKNNSCKLQKELVGAKTAFANEILYQSIQDENNKPSLPQYIQDGLDWLLKELNSNNGVK